MLIIEIRIAMNNNDLISVIVPLYNKEAVIKKTIDSVLAQTYQNLEVVVVDDESSDKSVDVVKEYKDSRLFLYTQKNGGPSSARNCGVRKSSGQWIIFLDADDTLYPNALEKMVAPVALDKEINMVCGNFNIVCGEKVKLQTLKSFKGRIPNDKIMKWLFLGDCYPRPGAALIKKDLLERYPFPEDLRRFEDDCAMILWMKNARGVYFLPDVVLNYNRDTAAASKPSKDYNKDFIFHMDFKKASFWEKCILGVLYGAGLKSYPEQRSILRQKYAQYDFYRYYGQVRLISRYLIRKYLIRK